MDGKKNRLNEPVATYPEGKVVRPIQLTPSSTDYATAAKLTARVLNLSGPLASKKKPCRQLLRLANLDA